MPEFEVSARVELDVTLVVNAKDEDKACEVADAQLSKCEFDITKHAPPSFDILDICIDVEEATEV